MDQYNKRVDSHRDEMQIQEHEIRLTAQGRRSQYVNYAKKKLAPEPSGEGEEKKEEEKPLRLITLRAMGQAINITVIVAESVKRLVPGLHQITNVSSSEITDVYEPLVEGLKTVTVTRRVPRIEITLSKDPPDDLTHVGYQPPLSEEELAAEKKNAKNNRKRDQPANNRGGEEGKRGGRRGRGRGRGRGRRGRRPRRGGRRNANNEESTANQESQNANPPQQNGDAAENGTQRGRRGRGRGRRGGRRRGRGRGRRGRRGPPRMSQTAGSGENGNGNGDNQAEN
mmetsp:Transcript_3397/g.7948  ORF Transcript_3397/g.7948 Transcript_3397/m.7948 type:complete len:283 (+) Transcript_3397:199-1047(+)